MGYYIGIDVGGTFTDVCVAADTGKMAVYKTPSTPDVATGVLDGVTLAARAAGLDVATFLKQVVRFGHGSTVAVNALLQRRGVRTGLITTRGFGDTLWLARMLAMTTGLPPEQWTHYRRRQRPDPMIERGLVREVPERIDFRGQVVVPLDLDAARQAIRELLADGIEALSICTLWSFRNPEHEEQLRQLALEMAPNLYVCISSELVPVIKEYERMATTVVNATLGPVVRDYVDKMASQLQAKGLAQGFFMLNSVGGVIPPAEAGAKPVHLLGSGPSGGVLAARQLAADLCHTRVITADMGGTSFDVGLLVDGEPVLVTEAPFGNLNLINPMIDIRSIGAGGGSLAAAVDGMLKVGPQSAGSYPGPACYGRGGTRPAVTDADLVLGFLNPDYFLGGKMKLDASAAVEAIRQHVAKPLGLSVLEAAAGIREIVDQQMADLLRQSTLERGNDPRDFMLYAYGGAGPVHAADFGAAAGVRAIVIPLAATVFSAQGILGADLRISRQRSVLQRSRANPSDRAAGLDAAALEQVFREIEAEVGAAMERYRVPGGGELQFIRSVNMRFARQVHEVRVPVTGPLVAPGALQRLVESFDQVYASRYGKGALSQRLVLEVTTCMVQGVQTLPKVIPAPPRPLGRLRPSGSRRVYAGKWLEVPVYRNQTLPPGAIIMGPGLVEAEGTTVWVSPRHQATVDQLGNLLMEAQL